MNSSDSTAASSSFAAAAATMSANVWYHVAGVYDRAANQIRLYVNGQLAGSAAFSTPWLASGPTVIGRGKWGNAVDYWGGQIDDVQLYQRALNGSEIAALSNN